MATEPRKYMLLGIGSRLNRDDSAGSIIAEEFRSPQWVVVDGGQMPENYTGVVKREAPDVLVIIDAAGMKLEPGEFRRISLDTLARSHLFNTHAAPPALFISYLQSFVNEIYFIGIQPQDTSPGESLSEAVREGIENIKKILQAGKIRSIPELKSLP
ncbi:MAG: hydrogenase 3 maturation endopeptidase HyCI [Spirochaetota bacterium]